MPLGVKVRPLKFNFRHRSVDVGCMGVDFGPLGVDFVYGNQFWASKSHLQASGSQFLDAGVVVASESQFLFS